MTIRHLWKILVVKCDTNFYDAIEKKLADFYFSGSTIDVIKSSNIHLAKEILKSNQDICMLILSINEDIDPDKIELINYIRNTLKNINLRIVVNADNCEPSQLYNIINKYDINAVLNSSDFENYEFDIKFTFLLREYTTLRNDINSRAMSIENEGNTNIQRNEVFLKNVIDCVNDGISLSNESGYFEIFNYKLTEITGYTANEANQSASFLSLLYPLQWQRDMVFRQLTLLREKQNIDNYETVITAKDGTKKTLLVSSTLLNHENKNLYLSVYHDITKRKRDQEKLLAVKNTLNSILESESSHSIIAFDTKQGVLHLNPAAEELFRKNTDDVKGMKIEEFSPFFYDTDKSLNNILDDVKQKGLAEFENKISNNDNSVRILHSVVMPMYTDYSNNTSYLIFSRDITKIKLTKQALEESEKKYRILIDNQNEGVALIDKNGVFQFANKAANTIFGFNDEVLVNKNIADFIAQPIVKKYLQLAKTLPTENNNSYEIKIQKADGVERHVSISLSPIIEENNTTFTNIMAIFRDVTEERKAKLTIKENEEKFRTIIETASDAILIADIETGIILDANKQAERLLGKSKEEIIGFHQGKLYPEEHNINDFKTLHSQANKDVSIKETSVINSKGDIIPVEINSSTFVLNSKRIALGIFRDISERNQVLLNLKKAKEQAEAANQAKNIFLANIGHEIRTPLNSVIGFADLLYSKIETPHLRDHINSIRSSGQTLLNLITDLLDLSKIEAGRMEIKHEPISIKRLLENIKSMTSYELIKKKIDYIVVANDNLPQNVYLDEIRIQQVLLNLVTNAIKFTSKGYVKISADFHITDQQYGSLYISIEDTGIGIPDEEQKRIFDIFYQSDKKDNKKYAGTGLGLAISKKLTRMMNGKISLKSTENIGSKFTISFNNIKYANQEHLAPIAINNLEEIQLRAATILLIDDILPDRLLITKSLRNTPLKIIEAENGQIGIQKAKEIMPDLILLDLRMPVLDGFETAKILKADSQLMNIPIIAITSSAIDQSIQSLKELGFDSFLRKPIDVQQLKNELNKLLPECKELKAETKDSNTISCTTKNIEDAIIKLDTVFLPKWKEFEHRQSIQAVDNFAHEIIVLGEKFKIPILIDYGIELCKQTKHFDIENMLQKITDFPNLLKELKSMV